MKIDNLRVENTLTFSDLNSLAYHLSIFPTERGCVHQLVPIALLILHLRIILGRCLCRQHQGLWSIIFWHI
jgi:hypothetical protein